MAVYDNNLAKTAARDALQDCIPIPASILPQEPFLRVRRFFGIDICHLSSDPIFPYPFEIFPNLSDRSSFDSIMKLVKNSNVDFLRLRYIPVSSLDELKIEQNHSCIISVHPTCKLALSDENRGANNPRTSKKSFRRSDKKIRKINSISFKVLEDGLEKVEAVDLLYNWKKDWLKRKRKFGFSFSDPYNIMMMRSVYVDNKNNNFPVFAMLDGTKIIAVECGVVYRNTYYSYMAAYDPSYSKLGIGKYLTHSIIENTADFGVNEYDFLPPSSQFKRNFGAVSTPKYADIIFAISYKSKFLLMLHKISNWIKLRR